MTRYCLALDLQNDETLIREYEAHHRAVWPEVLDSLRASGIMAMEIYRLSDRLFMVMEVNDEFSFDKKSAADNTNPVVEKWEKLMWKYQRAIPGTPDGGKWVLMNKIFDFKNE